MFFWLGGLHLLAGSKISSDGDAWTAAPGFIKLGETYIDPATGAEKGAVYGLKKAGEDIVPSGCTKRIYPSEMREVDAEKNVRRPRPLRPPAPAGHSSVTRNTTSTSIRKTIRAEQQQQQ